MEEQPASMVMFSSGFFKAPPEKRKIAYGRLTNYLEEYGYKFFPHRKGYYDTKPKSF